MRRLNGLIFGDAGRADPGSVDEYVRAGGFAALKKAVSMRGGDIISEIKKARLIEYGDGTEYPVGDRWERFIDVSGTPGYIVCNAGDGDPGTFKDRVILDGFPLRLVEGIAIAGIAFRAKAGYVHVRGEYRKIRKRLVGAIGNARAAGFLGRDILGTGFDFDIHVRYGAGVCVGGEDSALLNSAGVRAGRPCIRSPHPAYAGLFPEPAPVGNAESFAGIPAVIGMGWEEFLKAGRPDSGGTRLVCLSGHVRNRGVYEIPSGRLTLREIIYDGKLGGGIAGGKKLKFFHLGGQGGPVGGPGLLDTVYGHADLKKAGLSVGSGAVVVMDETVSVIDYLRQVAGFFVRESCGRCVPCREGNRHVSDILDRLLPGGGGTPGDIDTLHRLARTMADASFCGPGRTASAALTSAGKHFGAEFEAGAGRGANP